MSRRCRGLLLRFALQLKDDAGGHGRVGQPFFQGAGGRGAAAVACGAVLFLRILLTGAIGVGIAKVSVHAV